MAIRINREIVIDDNKKFYGDGSNLTNIAKNLIVGVRSGNAISTPLNLGSIIVYGRTSNYQIITA